MSYNTVIEQGSFTATGNPVTLNIASGFDWIRVYNYSAMIDVAGGNIKGYEYFYQTGMPIGQGIQWQKAIALTTSVLSIPVGNGFIPFNSAGNAINGVLPFGGSYAPLTAPVAVTGTTDAAPVVVTTGSTAGLSIGSIVRLSGIVGALDLTGIDFSITAITANTNFTLANVMENQPGAAGGAGFYSIVQFSPLYYPQYRYITSITPGLNTVFTTSVPSGFQVGQLVRLNIPTNISTVTNTPIYGTIAAQLDGQLATVMSVNDTLGTQTVTTNIDSTGYAFNFPTAAQAVQPYTRATIVPVAQNTSYSLSTTPPSNILADATYNAGITGVILNGAVASATQAAAVAGPAGGSTNRMYWIAGKSFSNTVGTN